MSTRITVAIAASLIAASLPASAEDAPQKLAQDAAAACIAGEAPVPQVSDFGHETGIYAIPVRDDRGSVIGAIMMSEDAVREVKACAVKLDRPEADLVSNNTAAQTAQAGATSSR